VLDDQALVLAAQSGDRDALDALLRRHYDRLHQICRRIAVNEADALDATQEALISIARGIPRFDGQSSFSTWAYRVTTNACLDELRRRRRRPMPVLDDCDDRGDRGTEIRGAPLGAGTRGDARIDAVADRLAVDAALAELPVDFRAAVVLRDLCDLDYAEIAHILEIPPGTVRSRIARGRAALARLLAEPEAGRNQPPASVRPTTTSPGPVPRHQAP
jgi:RNA polymerase sigma-70 factor (ECF subfamily)